MFVGSWGGLGIGGRVEVEKWRQDRVLCGAEGLERLKGLERVSSSETLGHASEEAGAFAGF